MSTIFSKIIAGEIPCHKIEENDKFLAFLDITPLAIGHTLVIPKVAVDYIFDLEDELLTELILFAKVVAKKIEAKIDCKKIGVAVIGLEVRHAHIHLVPINTVADINFAKEKLVMDSAQLKEIANRINS